jgi:succinoglycan biosynthesis transport protein ExoP
LGSNLEPNFTDSRAEEASLSDRLHVLWRRKFIVVQMVILVPLAAVLFSLTREPRYEASAGVLLSRQSLASTLTGTPDPGVYLQPERLTQTQAELARAPTIARRTLAAAGPELMSPEDFLDSSSVSPKPNADVLEFKVSHHDRRFARRLASEYARQFTIYRDELDSIAVKRASAELATRIAELERRGGRTLPLYASLREKQRDLETLAALETSGALVVRDAERAVQVAPRPALAGALGLALGLIVGSALAFFLEAFDTRVSSADEVRRRLRLPLLGQIPEPSRSVSRLGELALVVDPSSVTAEAFRILRTNIDLINLEHQAKTLLVTSAVRRESKSTTVANLALAFSQMGRHVALVDLDTRQPMLDSLFDIGSEQAGLTEVALGYVKLEDALCSIAFEEAVPTIRQGVTGGLRSDGHLKLLTCGAAPPNPGEFVASGRVRDILTQLQDRFDLVLIDAPPLLLSGDALALSARVDGIIVVTRLNVVRRPTLNEVGRILESSAAPPLGVVLTGVEIDGTYGHHYESARKIRERRSRTSTSDQAQQLRSKGVRNGAAPRQR